MVLMQIEKEKVIAHFLSLPIAEMDELEEDKSIADNAETLQISEIMYGILTGKVKGEWTHKENRYMESLTVKLNKKDACIGVPLSANRASSHLLSVGRDFESYITDALKTALKYLFREKPDNISDEVYAIFEKTVQNILHPPVKEKKVNKTKLVQQTKDEFITRAVEYVKTKISEKRFSTIEGENDFEKVDNWLKEREIKNSVVVEPIEATDDKMNIF